MPSCGLALSPFCCTLIRWILKSCDRECIALMARRRSGNMGSAPSSGNPFVRAAVYIKHREEPRTQVRG